MYYVMCNAVRGDDARSHIEPLTLVITACSVSRWDQDNIDNICTQRVWEAINSIKLCIEIEIYKIKWPYSL